MSQKNLKIRGKFINKIISKVQVLDDGLDLFSKVNKKIFQKNNNQKGGDDINITELQLETIVKKQTLKKQQEQLNLLKKTVEALSNKIQPINNAINQTTEEIKKINITIPDIPNSGPSIRMFSPNELNIIEKAFVNGDTWEIFSKANSDSIIIKNNLLTKEQYNRYVSPKNL